MLTDSLYIAFARDTIDECVRGENGNGSPPKTNNQKCVSREQKRYEVLESHSFKCRQHHEVENAGFTRDNRRTIKTYTQTKKGLGYFYEKRKVKLDGVSTTHLDI